MIHLFGHILTVSEKNYLLSEATKNVGQPRQVKIVTMVANGLLFEPITINVALRVIYPTYFLAKY